MDKTATPSPRAWKILLLVLVGVFVLAWWHPFLAVLRGTHVMALWGHVTMEIFSIVVAGLVFAVAWNSYSDERPSPLIVLACGLLGVALIDTGHALSFKGMPDFITPSGAEKAINFWLAARLLFALSLGAAALLPWRPLRNPRLRHLMLVACLLYAVLVFWRAIFWAQNWPRTFIEGQGLTPFKIGFEYCLMALLLVPAAVFLGRAWRDSAHSEFAWLGGAAVATILSELAFTLYSDVADIMNLLGHLYKIVAFLFIYRAVFVASVQEPFLRLHDAKSQVEMARKQYAVLAELAPVGIFRTDAAGSCLYVNDRWLRFAGLSLVEALGDGWSKALHPDDQERIVSAWLAATRDGTKFSEEYRFIRPDGRVTWVYGQAMEELDANGRVVGYVGTVTDLTDRKAAEARVMEAEERMRLILDSLDSLVYVADMQTYELLFMNKYGREIWGEPGGRLCWQVLQSDQCGPCPFCTNDKLLDPDGNPNDGYIWEFQNILNLRWYDCRDQAIRWHDGRLVRLEIATDITDRKQAEQSIQNAKDEWERTFDAIGDIATIQDSGHRILRANRRAGEVFGVKPEELVGRHCYEVFHQADTPCPGCPALLTASDSGSHTAEVTHQQVHRTFAVTASPIQSPDGGPANIVYIARDITELKALERQLRQAQKMEAVGTLAGGIAHDFNNILTPVLGYSEIIAESLPKESPLIEPAREVLKAGRRARDLVKQILSFSRQAEQERNPIEMQLVVKEVLKLLRSSLPTTIEIRQNVSSDCGSVLADPTMIHQVMMNLCTNAYHAMRDTGGILAVSLGEVEIGPDDYVTELHLKPGPYLRLEVSDTGCGMPQHIVDRIFEPYFTTKEKGEGTGLGLSVVHGIVTSLGGHVTVYSEAGKGTTFHVYLPRCQQANGILSGAAARALSLPRGDEHVLVVDDEKVIVDLMRQILTSLGYRVTTCIDSRQALEQFEAQPTGFDMLITDMTMPHLTGAELAQQAMAIRPELPVILCTGFSEIINEEKAKALGIRRLLMKPVLRDELARVLREIFDQK
ncbi:MAG: MASE3 domain-containing protein [Thermodesulfobacteriota bacterium]